MKSRRHGSRTTLALWAMVAATDLAMLVAGSGVLAVLVVVAALAALAGGVVTARVILHRPARVMPRRLMAARPHERHSVIRYSPGRVDRRCDRPLGQAARRPA